MHKIIFKISFKKKSDYFPVFIYKVFLPDVKKYWSSSKMLNTTIIGKKLHFFRANFIVLKIILPSTVV